MMNRIIARLRKRVRVLKAAWTQTWHDHHCACGAEWVCCARFCAQPNLCALCEGAQLDAWAQDRQRTKGVA